MSDDEVIVFNFAGVEPATFGEFRALPRGEYQLQCVECEKYFAKDTSGQPDSNKPQIRWGFRVINHPDYDNTEFLGWKGLSHPLRNEKAMKFLLNTLMCLIPEVDWAKDGIQVPLSQLIERSVGKTVNAFIDWEVNAGTGDNANKRYVNNKIKSLKPYDATVPPPKASEGNPPIISNNANGTSPIAQQAMAGVPAEEVNSFLNDWPGGTPQASAAAPPSSSDNFLDGF